MLKKSFLTIIFILIIATAGFFFNRQKKNIISINNNQADNKTEVIKKEAKPGTAIQAQKFFVSGWLPYWQKLSGADSLTGNLASFSEINPFAFGFNSDGALQDKAVIKAAPWPELIAVAKNTNTTIIPTILWADAPAMHRIFSDPQKLEKHVQAIFKMMAQNDFSGVDIDYEGKDVADKNLFTVFLQALNQKLKPVGKTISCTVEARSQDNPPVGWTGTRAMSFANDYSALNENCDSVRIMAYDQVFQVNGGQKVFDVSGEAVAQPNADIHWVETVMRYAMQTISPSKLVMGVPTYGWEFRVTKTAVGYHYEKVRSVTYPQALEEQMKNEAKLERTAGGEPFFSYETSDGKQLIIFSDAASVKQKIALAKNLGLKGISLFKIDGQTDPKIFSLIKEDASE